MPELPEVEHFRQMLLPLVSSSSSSSSSKGTNTASKYFNNSKNNSSSNNKKTVQTIAEPLTFVLPNTAADPPKKWLSLEQVELLNTGNVYCSAVLRKGKQLCMVLERLEDGDANNDNNKYYLYLHMGMTGRITAPGKSCRLENVKAENDAQFPPKYTYLLIQKRQRQRQQQNKNSNNVASDTAGDRYCCAFSDPRKFGSCLLSDTLDVFDTLAPDALLDWIPVTTPAATTPSTSTKASSKQLLKQKEENHHTGDETTRDESIGSDDVRQRIVAGVTNQSLGIKAILLDQKRVVCGVGNWVADEVLYQCHLHPDQTHLSHSEAVGLLDTLHSILKEAIDCLMNGNYDYPENWLFRYRWTKKKEGTDYLGRKITSLTSGGRTSAIVPSLQILHPRQKATTAVNKAAAAPRRQQQQGTKRTASKKKKGSTIDDDNNDMDTGKIPIKGEVEEQQQVLLKTDDSKEAIPNQISSSSNVVIETNKKAKATVRTKKSNNKRSRPTKKAYAAAVSPTTIPVTEVVQSTITPTSQNLIQNDNDNKYIGDDSINDKRIQQHRTDKKKRETTTRKSPVSVVVPGLEDDNNNEISTSHQQQQQRKKRSKTQPQQAFAQSTPMAFSVILTPPTTTTEEAATPPTVAERQRRRSARLAASTSSRAMIQYAE